MLFDPKRVLSMTSICRPAMKMVYFESSFRIPNLTGVLLDSGAPFGSPGSPQGTPKATQAEEKRLFGSDAPPYLGHHFQHKSKTQGGNKRKRIPNHKHTNKHYVPHRASEARWALRGPGSVYRFFRFRFRFRFPTSNGVSNSNSNFRPPMEFPFPIPMV